MCLTELEIDTHVSVVIYDSTGARLESHTIALFANKTDNNNNNNNNNNNGNIASDDPNSWRAFFRDTLSALPHTCSSLPVQYNDERDPERWFQIEFVVTSSNIDESSWVPLGGGGGAQHWNGTINPVKVKKNTFRIRFTKKTVSQKHTFLQSLASTNRTHASAFVKVFDPQ
jgi:hypothetical protein